MGLKELHRLDPLGHFVGLTPQDVMVWIRHVFDNTFGAAGGTFPLIEEDVNKGQVLIISSIKYRLVFPLTWPAGETIGINADDNAAFEWLSFQVLKNRRQAYDERRSTSGALDPILAGTHALNRNVLGEGDDTPMHLVIREGEQLRIEYTLTTATPSYDQQNTPRVGVEVIGRRMSVSLYDKLARVGRS